MQKLRVGILGATGTVGQAYLTHLVHHPFFEVTFLGASKKSSNQTYQSALIGKGMPLPQLLEGFATYRVYDAFDVDETLEKCDFVFSAVDSSVAQQLEPLYASKGLPVLSNASAHRMEKDIPILIPELNSHHLDIIDAQKQNRGWDSGFIVTKSNCSLMSYLIPLFPLHEKFRLKKLMVTTLQAVSGAGYPGISSLDILGNVIPYIPKEEEKSEQEPLKILGEVQSNEIHSLKDLSLSVTCNRVPVLNGHLACVNVEFETKPKVEEILEIWEQYTSLPQQMKLPSAPIKPIHYLAGQNRPQPKLDLEVEKGMAVSVGRLRPCSTLHYRFTALSHNVQRGAALGGILNAELLYKLGYLKKKGSNTISEILQKLF